MFLLITLCILRILISTALDHECISAFQIISVRGALDTETNVDEIYLLNFISGIPCQLTCHISFTCGIVSIDTDANHIGQHNLKGSPERLESFEHVNDIKLKLFSLSIRSGCCNQFNC